MEIHEQQGHPPLPRVNQFQWPESGVIDDKEFMWIDVEFSDASSRTAVFEKTPEGLKLDWESFVFFADPVMSEFVSRQPEAPAVYRVVCSIDDYYNRLYDDEQKFLCLKVVGPDDISSCWAYTSIDSEESWELSRLFRRNEGLAEAEGSSAPKPDQEPTIKIMLKLRFVKDANGESNSQAWIDGIVSDSWIMP